MSKIAKLRQVLTVLAIAGAATLILTFAAVWYFQQPAVVQVLWALRAGAFIIGFVFLGLLAYVGLAPGMLSKLFVTIYGAAATLARPVSRVWLDADGEYHIERAEPPDDGETYRFLFGEAWFDYERSTRSFSGSATESIDIEALDEVDSDTLSGQREIHGPERGGHKSYLRTDEQSTKWIKYGEVLENFRDRALELINEAHDFALREHGGDTSGHSGKIVFGGMAFFSTMGIVLGFIIFF